jgi:hypothetical protein
LTPVLIPRPQDNPEEEVVDVEGCDPAIPLAGRLWDLLLRAVAMLMALSIPLLFLLASAS